MTQKTVYDFRHPQSLRIESDIRVAHTIRRKEDLALLLAITNLKFLREQTAPIDKIYQQIDYLDQLVDQIMNRHRNEKESISASNINEDVA